MQNILDKFFTAEEPEIPVAEQELLGFPWGPNWRGVALRRTYMLPCEIQPFAVCCARVCLRHEGSEDKNVGQGPCEMGTRAGRGI